MPHAPLAHRLCVSGRLPPDVTHHPQAEPATGAFAPLPAFTPTPFAESQKGDRDKTLTYWKGVKEILERKGSSSSFSDSVNEAKKMVNDLRALPAVGVDPELLEHVEALARSVDHLMGAIEFAKENPSAARRVGAEHGIVLCGQQAIDLSSQVRGLRGKLSQRYGVEFPAAKGT
jgi:hypothetical protein